jgi:uncharacterized protein (TIGR02271 family)
VEASVGGRVPIVPVIEEQVSVGKRVVERERVRLRTRTSAREEIVDVPLVEEEVRVQRVEVGRIVDAPEPPRQHGDTLVVPVYEEVLVVEKRLLLREELHVTRVRHERHDRRSVVLRREDVEVERAVPRSASR